DVARGRASPGTARCATRCARSRAPLRARGSVRCPPTRRAHARRRPECGAGALGGGRGPHRVRLVGAACFAQRCDVINVDVEPHAVLPSGHSDPLEDAFVRPRLLVLVALGALACGGGSGSQTPAPQSLPESLAQFMSAIKANDLDRLKALWGTERGPASGWMKGEELKQRLTVLQIYLNHVGYRVIEGPLAVPTKDDRRVFRIEL